MIKHTFILILFLFPAFVFADNYEGVAGAAKSFGDYVTDFWSFFDDDVPSFFQRATSYVLEKLILMKINFELGSMKLAWTVAKSVMENFQVASKVASAANALPQDVKAALVDMRLFDGVNVIVQAYIARYVLRFL
ncbi:MAG: DUF2523 family protein [Pseudoalteromonas nigrifaciens]|uniref:DUF2523 family protein n=1 Tax=Pseudoalteromonas nigrifaciens TaxID=28109 RepID=UPI003F9AA9DE